MSNTEFSLEFQSVCIGGKWRFVCVYVRCYRVYLNDSGVSWAIIALGNNTGVGLVANVIETKLFDN